jgi:hypothetical protein
MNRTSEGETIEDLWVSERMDIPRITVDYVRHRAAEHDRRISRSNAMQWIVIVFACTAILFYVWQVQVLAVRAGLMLILVYVVRTSITWHRKSRPETVSADFGVLSALAFYRRQLERQRDVRDFDWRVWLGGMTAAAAFEGLLIVGGNKPWSLMRFGIMLSVTAVGLAIYSFFELRQRRELEQEIRALDTLKDS